MIGPVVAVLIGGGISDAAAVKPWMAAGYQHATTNRYGLFPQVNAITSTGSAVYHAPPGYDITAISWTSWGDHSGSGSGSALSASAQFQFYAGTQYLTSSAVPSSPGGYVGLIAPGGTTAFGFFIGGQSPSQSTEELYVTQVGLARPGQSWPSVIVQFRPPPRVAEGTPAKHPWFYP